MLVTRIIAALWALVKRLGFGSSNPTPPPRPSNAREPLQTESPLPELSVVARDDAPSDSPQSSASTSHREAPDDRDAPSDEQLDDDHQSTDSINGSVRNASDSTAADPESALSNFGKAGQPPPNSAEVEHEKSDTSPSTTNEDRQSSPPKENRHPKSDEPNGDAGFAVSPRERPGTDRTPRRIRGRRDRPAPKPRPKPEQPPASRPELVCRKIPAAGMWEVVLSANDDCPLAAVDLEGTRLDLTNQECCVPSLTGRLAVSCQDGQELNMPLFDGIPLIFKLRKKWAGKGRKTSGITSGHFIVIAPGTWERIGRVPVEPDSCSDAAFRAHYFYKDTATPDEDVDGFRECDVFPNASGIDLTGQSAFDDSEEGALFVGDAPFLKSSPDIAWVRIGEEAEHGWKGENFEPAKQSLSDVLNGREGHFFLRVYDSQASLLDSAEFRYLHDLKQIRVNGLQYTQDTVLVPHSSGYPPTEVRFVDADGTAISPVMASEATHATARSGVLDVPPYPDADRISCTLGSDASGVSIVLELPRIWWRMEYDRGDTDSWRDTPLIMTQQEFRNHACKNATMSVLSKRFPSVRVGFDDELNRVCRRTIEEDRISISLAEFVDYKQIDQRLNDDAHFNVLWAGEVLPLIRISADPMPGIVSFSAEPAAISAGQEAILRWATRNAGQACVVIHPDVGVVDSDGSCSVWPTETMKYTLTLAVSGTDDVTRIVTVTVDSPPAAGGESTARVRCARGRWRNGKGFSSRELQDTGLTVREAAGRSIPIDRRRRSSHPANVEAIRRMLHA